MPIYPEQGSGGGGGGESGGVITAVTRVSSDYTASTGEAVDVDASGGAVTVTLPGTPTQGVFVHVKKKDSSSNDVTIDGNGNTIDGNSSLTISNQNDGYTMYFNGNEWSIM